jgi:hypothetical protein
MNCCQIPLTDSDGVLCQHQVSKLQTWNEAQPAWCQQNSLNQALCLELAFPSPKTASRLELNEPGTPRQGRP